jgi:hypothetical protein
VPIASNFATAVQVLAKHDTEFSEETPVSGIDCEVQPDPVSAVPNTIPPFEPVPTSSHQVTDGHTS